MLQTFKSRLVSVGYPWADCYFWFLSLSLLSDTFCHYFFMCLTGGSPFNNILKDSFHLVHHLFELLPSGKCLQVHQNTHHKIHQQFLPQSHHRTELRTKNTPPHFTIMEHMFCIRWQTGMTESMSEESGWWMKALFFVFLGYIIHFI